MAWLFVASPMLIVVFGGGRYSVGEAAVPPVIGCLTLLWFTRRPGIPEHVTSVKLVHPTGDDAGPDARTEPFYLARCDCG